MRFFALLTAISPLFCSEIYYNTPAAVALAQKWTGFADASFLYWYAEEEGLSLAESALLLQGNLLLAQTSESLESSFSYQPAFKIGVGTIYQQEWVLGLSYLWFRGHTSKSAPAPANNSAIGGLGVWSVDDWFQQTISLQEVNTTQGQSLSGTEIAASWRLGLDLFDLALSRPFYEGVRCTVTPFAALRAAWIRQAVKVALTQAAGSEGGASNLLPQPIYSHNHSNCWGIGPLMGCRANCLLPLGFRLEGSMAGSLLATTFTTLSHSEDAQSTLVSAGPYQEKRPTTYQLLPNAEMGLGIGWGKYSARHRYHWDLSASYDFTIFWGQNMLRQTLDHFWAGIDGKAGDLFFHGLTLSGRFDF